MMKNSVEIKNVSKTYPNFKLNNVSFNIEPGTIMGLIGENGAGKTTLIKLLLGIISTEGGSIKIFDQLVSEEVKEDIGIVLDSSFFPEIFNAEEINTVLKSTYKTWDEQKFRNYMEQFKIPTKQQLKTLSKGMRKKLEIATALSHNPKLLILDEPTGGLDPVVRNEILDIFADFIQDENNSVLLSSHITTDLEHVADYITMIDDGEIVFTKSQDELRENFGLLKCDEKSFEKIDKEDIISYKKNRYNYEILVSDRNKLKKKYKDIVIDKANIEDIMLMYIKGEK